MHGKSLFFTLLLTLGSAGAHAAQCTGIPELDAADTDWSGWGNGYSNTRFAPEGLSSADLDRLGLRWAFGFPGTGSVIGNPVVHGNTLFIGVDSGDVYALDTETACVYWSVNVGAGVRTAPALARINGRPILYFGDRNAVVHAVDALAGTRLWQTEVDSHPAAILTGSPQFIHLDGENAADRLLVPVSSSEEGLGAVPTYNCCTFRGSVVSLNAATGAILWQSHTIQPAPRATGDNTSGPSGGAIWSAPTIDLANRRMIVATGDAYSAPADIGTDALIAMDLLTGDQQWLSQSTADDIWTVACMTPRASEDCGPDQDYGSPAMLLNGSSGSFLLAGQKSGIVRAFDINTGAVDRATALVENTTEFGGKIIWGGASDGRLAWFGLGTGGVAGLDVLSGDIRWFNPLTPAPGRGTPPGHDGPLTASADVVISDGWDGMVRILAAGSGEVLWQYDALRSFDTVNGVAAKGGSMGAAGPVVSGKRLFVPSGYAGVKNGAQGNVLLMFSP